MAMIPSDTPRLASTDILDIVSWKQRVDAHLLAAGLDGRISPAAAIVDSAVIDVATNGETALWPKTVDDAYAFLCKEFRPTDGASIVAILRSIKLTSSFSSSRSVLATDVAAFNTRFRRVSDALAISAKASSSFYLDALPTSLARDVRAECRLDESVLSGIFQFDRKFTYFFYNVLPKMMDQ